MTRKQTFDLSGKRFHMLTVIDEHITEKAGRWWNCYCDCGNTRVALGSEMKRGGTKSCGCSRTKATDWTGRRFGILTATRLLSPKGTKHAKWESLCDCGNTHTASIDDMKAGKTTSCGCKLTSTRESAMLGKRFGKLEVTSSSHKVVNQWFYKCICHACGNTEHVVNGMSLRNGTARSCGCSRVVNDWTGVTVNNVYVIRKVDDKWLCRCGCDKEWLVRSGSLRTIVSCGCKQSFDHTSMVGTTHGSFTLLNYLHGSKHAAHWEVMCKCGTVLERTYPFSGDCGCSRNDDFIGKTYGLLHVDSFAGVNKLGKSTFACTCKCGGSHTTTRNDLVTGQVLSCGCAARFPHHRSQFEVAVKDFIESIGVTIEVGVRINKLKSSFTHKHARKRGFSRMEVDGYSAAHKVAIECDGVTWHSDRFSTTSLHVTKDELCAEAGVQLVHIRDDEWRAKRPIVESILRHVFGKTEVRVFARKCKVLPMSSSDYDVFVVANHLHGCIPSSVRLGLYLDGRVVAAIGLRKKGGGMELSRFAVKLNTVVVGGLSKLIHATGVDRLTTYIDTGVFTGSGYLKCGFNIVRTGTPSICYEKNGMVKSRQDFQRRRVQKWLAPIPDGVTLDAHAKNHGWHKLTGSTQTTLEWIRGT